MSPMPPRLVRATLATPKSPLVEQAAYERDDHHPRSSSSAQGARTTRRPPPPVVEQRPPRRERRDDHQPRSSYDETTTWLRRALTFGSLLSHQAHAVVEQRPRGANDETTTTPGRRAAPTKARTTRRPPTPDRRTTRRPRGFVVRSPSARCSATSSCGRRAAPKGREPRDDHQPPIVEQRPRGANDETNGPLAGQPPIRTRSSRWTTSRS